MPITITAEQRDALYDLILDRIGGIEDLRLVVYAKDYEAAERLGWEYSDSLRLVSEDLGWGKGPGGRIELKTPPDVLCRVFTRLRDAALSHSAYQEQERAEVREAEDRNRLVVEACQEVLAGLGSHRPIAKKTEGR